MSYNLAYTTSFRSLDDDVWEILIHIDGFDGNPTVISLEGDEPCVIEWQETGKMDVVQSSTCTLRVSNESDRQMVRLMHGRNALCTVVRTGRVYWMGHLDDAVYEEPYSFPRAYVTELIFSDFGILNRIPFLLEGRQSLAAIVGGCIGAAIPVGYPVSLLTSLRHPKTNEPITLDMLYINADRFATDGDEPTTQREVLEEALRPLGLRIMQKNGQVYIYDIEYLRDHADTMANYPVWHGTDAWLRGSETFGRIDVSFEHDADETLASLDIDREHSVWPDDPDGPFFGLIYSEDFFLVGLGHNLMQGFFVDIYPNVGWPFPALPSGARYFRTRALLADANDTGIAWRLKCTTITGYVQSGQTQIPVYADAWLAANATARNLADTRPVVKLETGYLPLVPDADKYQLRVNLDILLSFRPNPIDSPPDEWVEQQDWYTQMGGEKDWRHFRCFMQTVPVKLELIDEGGNPIWHYTNAATEDEHEPMAAPLTRARVSPKGAVAGSWEQGAATWADMVLAYYKDYDPDNDDDPEPLAASGWTGNRLAISDTQRQMIKASVYAKRTDGEYLPLPPVAGRLRLTVGSGVFPYKMHNDLGSVMLCYPNIAWHLFRNPQITLVKARCADDAITTDAATEKDYYDMTADHLGETLQAGTWQKGIAPSARGLLFDAYGHAWEQLVKCGVTDTLSRLRLLSLVEQTRYTQPVISGTARLCHVFCAFKEWSTEGTFIAVGIRQDLHQATEHLTLARIGSWDDEPGGGSGGGGGGGIQPYTAWQAAWTDPLCAQQEARFAFVWADPLCTQKPDFQAAWTVPLCTQRYQYDLNWEDMLEDH